MKKFKTILAIVILIFCIPVMQSCLDSENDDLDNVQSNIPSTATMATVAIPSAIVGEAIIDDDKSGRAYVINPSILTDNNANNEGQRILYSYKSAESPKGPTDGRAFIGITWMLKVLTKSINTLVEGEEDIYGNDPISITGKYVSKSHLNLQFQILGYNPNIKHRISLVASPDSKLDSKGNINVELRHNAEGDLQTTPSFGYVSFTLDSVPGFKEGTLKGFIITNRTLSLGIETTEVPLISTNSKSIDFNLEYPSNTKTK